ncbi:hypothetical protein [Spiroplasma endosymbiont of Atherix ibis]|uniref:hypothetical protein n=1 Tax=Spiroplasma endosymbiont of Atherix ibis TaxID=3066291 RepID=UPI0030D420EC
MSAFIFFNYSNDLKDYDTNSDTTRYNNKIDFTFNNQYVSFVLAKDGAKDKNPDLLTFKLGYLAVNFKYEKLFKLSENQKSKFFIKFM